MSHFPQISTRTRSELDKLFSGRTPTKWVTRERPKIDRIACPWLILRFIDPKAQFLYVPAKDGKLIRLDNVVSMQPTQSVSQINRLDRQRQVTLQASVAPGYGLADRNASAIKRVGQIGSGELRCLCSTALSGLRKDFAGNA